MACYAALTVADDGGVARTRISEDALARRLGLFRHVTEELKPPGGP